MQVILLERVDKLGQMGDVVSVKPGYARNYLLPRNKALRATANNIAYFDAEKKALEATNLKKRAEAEKVAKKLDGLKVILVRSASETGQLYGSVSARDIATIVTEKGFTLNKNQVRMEQAYKTLGLFPIKVDLHPEVAVAVTVNIARSEEEAKIQEEKGGALITTTDDEDEKAATPVAEEAPAETPDAQDGESAEGADAAGAEETAA